MRGRRVPFVKVILILITRLLRSVLIQVMIVNPFLSVIRLSLTRRLLKRFRSHILIVLVNIRPNLVKSLISLTIVVSLLRLKNFSVFCVRLLVIL